MATTTDTTTTKLPLFPRRSSKPREIEVTPGKVIVDLPPAEVPRICVADLIPTGDPSTYRAVARVHQAQLRLTPDTLHKLNLGVRMDTMRRLIKAGFVSGGRVAPSSYVFDLHSYFEHVERVKKASEDGGDFWTKANLAKYREAI